MYQQVAVTISFPAMRNAVLHTSVVSEIRTTRQFAILVDTYVGRGYGR